MLAAAAAFPKAPVIKRERGDPGRAEPSCVRTSDLLLDPGERAGERDCGAPITRNGKPEVAHKLHAFAAEDDPLSFDGHTRSNPAGFWSCQKRVRRRRR